jgi:hypothetical protein
MENYLEEFHCHKNIFSRFHTSKSTPKVSEALQTELTLDKLEAWESDPAWNKLCAAAKCHSIDEDELQIESAIAEHLVDQSDLNFVKVHPLNNFFDHIHRLGNQLHVCYELPGTVRMDHKQAYRQSNCHEAAFQILQTNNQQNVCQYHELNGNAIK